LVARFDDVSGLEKVVLQKQKKEKKSEGKNFIIANLICVFPNMECMEVYVV